MGDVAGAESRKTSTEVVDHVNRSAGALCSLSSSPFGMCRYFDYAMQIWHMAFAIRAILSYVYVFTNSTMYSNLLLTL